MTPEQVRTALDAIGVACRLEDVQLQQRGDRWFAFIPGDRVAVFPISADALARVTRERHVLRALAQRCSFVAPRILAEAPDASWDLRALVPGVHDTVAVYTRVRTDPIGAQQVGAALGAMIAELHTRLRPEDVGIGLPSRPEWPESRAWIHERLPSVSDDRALHAAVDRIIARFEDSEAFVAQAERVVVHTDLGLHNIAIERQTLAVHGIFDWEAACWSDRHYDFRHLVFDGDRHELLEAAVGAYEMRTGIRISRARVFLHNAAMAATYLAFRHGVAPDASWCGRTLDEDLRWTRSAIARVEHDERS